MRHKKYIGIGIALLFLAVFGWRLYGNYAKAGASTAKPTKAVTTVEMKKATIGSIAASISTTGTIQGIQEATITAKTAGRIQHLGVNDGSYVTAGQSLLELDAAEIHAQIDQALANRNQAVANRDNARINADRLNNLFQEDAAARQQLDNATTQYYVNDAQVSQATATLNLYQAQLSNTVLTAPFSGYIFNKRVVLGDMAMSRSSLMSVMRSTVPSSISLPPIPAKPPSFSLRRLAISRYSRCSLSSLPLISWTLRERISRG